MHALSHTKKEKKEVEVNNNIESMHDSLFKGIGYNH